jgi:hypothetical protein
MKNIQHFSPGELKEAMENYLVRRVNEIRRAFEGDARIGKRRNPWKLSEF